ncbi:hypothetical protein HN51_018861, partial [Arachis hypogaea]
MLASCSACSAVFDLLLTSCFALLYCVQSSARVVFYSALLRSIFFSCHSKTSALLRHMLASSSVFMLLFLCRRPGRLVYISQ